MGRSAADRAFGFKSKGLLRILTAADIDEVKEALVVLQIRVLPSEAGQTIKALIKAPFEALGQLLDIIFASVIPLNENLAELVRLLDVAIGHLTATEHDSRSLHFRDIEAALAILRPMRAALAREILLQSEFTSSARRIETNVQALEEASEVAINEALAIETVA